MNIAVYTANIGGKDDYNGWPGMFERDVDYFYYQAPPAAGIDAADGRLNVMPFDWHPPAGGIDEHLESAMRASKAPKIALYDFPEIWDRYEYSVWIDAACTVKRPIRQMLLRLRQDKTELAYYDHGFRACAYREAAHCVEVGAQDTAAKLLAQSARMKTAGFPQGYGLPRTPFIWRRHTKAIEEICQDWDNETRLSSRNDQISLPFVLWKAGYTKQVRFSLEDFKAQFQRHRHNYGSGPGGK